MADLRYIVRPARGGGFIVMDAITGRNVAFDRRDVKLTFGAHTEAVEVCTALNEADQLMDNC